jgi:hypothetical protein
MARGVANRTYQALGDVHTSGAEELREETFPVLVGSSLNDLRGLHATISGVLREPELQLRARHNHAPVIPIIAPTILDEQIAPVHEDLAALLARMAREHCDEAVASPRVEKPVRGGGAGGGVL